jgi:hypothetical protein
MEKMTNAEKRAMFKAARESFLSPLNPRRVRIEEDGEVTVYVDSTPFFGGGPARVGAFYANKWLAEFRKNNG